LLLLQEQIPKTTGFYSSTTDSSTVSAASPALEMRVIKTPDTPAPEVQLLSNGAIPRAAYQCGGGYSRWKNNAVTRWREDSTCDNWVPSVIYAIWIMENSGQRPTSLHRKNLRITKRILTGAR